MSYSNSECNDSCVNKPKYVALNQHTHKTINYASALAREMASISGAAAHMVIRARLNAMEYF